MNALTDKTGADVAWSRPVSIDADLILNYSGSARADRAYIDQLAKPWLFGFESSTTRAYAGFDAGVADAHWHLGRVREVGYPDGCGHWVCAADERSTAAVFWAGITEYFRGWRAVLGPNVRLIAYGNPDAVNAAVAGGADLRWGVGTWGYGEGRGANQPPGEADAELVQSGNTPGPAEGTDHNWLYADLSVFAAWGGPAPDEEDDDDMPRAFISKQSDPTLGIWEQAANTRRHVGPDEWAAIAFIESLAGKPAPEVLAVSDQWWASLPDVASLADPAGGPGPAPEPADPLEALRAASDTQLVDEVTRRLATP